MINKSILFNAFATGKKIRLTSRFGLSFYGTIVAIEMETGPQGNEQPNSWNVKMVSDDDVVNIHIRTQDM